jgi:hypothetical protein
MAGFCLASEIGPSPSERDAYEEMIRKQAEQLQEARNASQSGGMKPEEKQALVRLLSDLSRKIEDLEKDKKDLQKEIYDLRELSKRTLKAHFKRMDDMADEFDERISELEAKGAAQDTDVAREHINTLASELLTKAKAGQRGVTYTEAAKILGIGKSRVCQLRTLIASDSRFNISWHPNRKNMKIICLKKFPSKEIVELNVQLGAENPAE